jgi:hypothetical protein
MSSTCAKRAKLALTVAKSSYMINTPGGRVVAKQIAIEVPLEFAGQVFPHPPHRLRWTRDSFYSGNELDEVA